MRALLSLLAWLPGLVTANAAADIAADGSASLGASLLAEGLRMLAPPAAPRGDALLGIEIEHQLPKHLLRRVQLRIDDGAPIEYEYSDAQAQALASGAAQMLVWLPLAVGEHRLAATFSAREANGSAIAPRIERGIKQDLSLRPGVQTIQLALQGDGLFSKPLLQLRHDVNPDSSAAADARFLLASGQPLAALASLQHAGSLSGEAQWIWVRARQQLGLPAASAQSSAQSTAQSSAQSTARSSAAVAADTGHLLRYNQALTQARQGQDAAALLTLKQLADDDAQGGEALAVRDLALLTLGYRALHLRDAEQASEAFRRIRSPGPYAEQGLLGLGWAQVAPVQAPPLSGRASLWPERGDDSEAARHALPFADAGTVARGEQAEALQDALAPWTELVGGDPLNPAVQEAMLALPYVMTHLGAQDQARRYYERAIGTLEQTHSNLLAASEHLQSGQLIEAMFPPVDAATATVAEDWHWRVAALIYTEDSRYLEPLLHDAVLSAGMARMHHLHELIRLLEVQRQLAGDSPDVSTDASTLALQTRASQLADQLAKQWQQQALIRLHALQRQTDDYLAEAHFALAGFYDRGTEGTDALSFNAQAAHAEPGT